jgi:methyl coenzyme M reductase subunit C
LLSYTCVRCRSSVDSNEGGCRAVRGFWSEGSQGHLVAGGTTPGHLEALEEIERDGLPGLTEVLRQEGLDAARFVLWDLTGWHEEYALTLALRTRVTEEQKRRGWEVFVRIEKILATVLHEVLRQQVEETMEVFSWGPEGFYD